MGGGGDRETADKKTKALEGARAYRHETMTPTQAVLWWHDNPTDADIFRYRDTLVSILTRHNISVAVPFSFGWSSWTGPSSDEWYNEVSVAVRNSRSSSRHGRGKYYWEGGEEKCDDEALMRREPLTPATREFI